MPEFLRSLLVVLFLATGIFYFAKKYAQPLGLDPKVLQPRITAWYLITCAAFLSPNFWIFAAIAAFVLNRAAKQDKNPLALSFFVLYAVPLFQKQIPGAGIVNYLFDINYFHLILFVIFVPLYLKICRAKDTAPLGSVWPDKFIIGYVVYSLVLFFFNTTITNFARFAFTQCLDVLLPYYVASRYFRTLNDFVDAIQALLIASCIAASIAILEFAKGWLLYSTLAPSFDIFWGYGGYLRRGESLRALASSGQAIVLGYTMAVALGLYWYQAKKHIQRQRNLTWAIGLLLCAGLFAPVSRGPWVGAAFMFLVFIFLEPAPLQRLLKLGVLAFIPSLIFLLTPYGAKFINYLPFVGSVDAETVTYRQDLLENSLHVIRNNLWFGSSDYLNTEEMESMRAGANGGIVDLVNSYIAIALSGGLVGLVLFVGYFCACTYSAFFGLRHAKGADERILGQALLGTMLGIMFMIYTVSSILMIPVLYWLLGGGCVAYSLMVRNQELVSVNK